LEILHRFACFQKNNPNNLVSNLTPSQITTSHIPRSMVMKLKIFAGVCLFSFIPVYGYQQVSALESNIL